MSSANKAPGSPPRESIQPDHLHTSPKLQFPQYKNTTPSTPQSTSDHLPSRSRNSSSPTSGGPNISFPASVTTSSLSAPNEHETTTRRRSSSILQHLRRESITDQNDQLAQTNLNAEWVHHKGAWVVHIVLIVALFMFYDGIPWVDAELTWTLTNITYVIGSYIMFHYVTGVPFDFNAGAYDTLTMWEQIDDGDQYTPTKKFLLGVPIGLFLISTHFTHYDLSMFLVNLFFCLMSVLPKLPASHRLRLVVSDEPPSPTLPKRRLSKELH